jgi:predicted N-acetyltransferase YhbS
MVSNKLSKKKILFFILTLGAITPIGTVVGMVLTHEAEVASETTQSMAVGVLQVSFFRRPFFVNFSAGNFREISQKKC